MQPFALLIQQPAVDFAQFLGASQQLLGRSPAADADASLKKLSDAERFLWCLASMKNRQGVQAQMLSHVSFSVMVAALEDDLRDMIELASLPHVTVETVRRGVLVAVITGTLGQWKTAVIFGSGISVEGNVRNGFLNVLACFEKAGLGHVWNDCARRQTPGGLYLEFKG